MSGYDILDQRTERTPREPVCGQYFCDACGACLVCYGEDECAYGGGNHLWVIKGEEKEAWRCPRSAFGCEISASHAHRVDGSVIMLDDAEPIAPQRALRDIVQILNRTRGLEGK